MGKASFGLGAAALGFAQAQQKLGLDVAVWTCYARDDRLEIERSYDLLPETVRVFPTWGPMWLGFSPIMENTIRKASPDYDVLHQHGIWTGISRATNVWRNATHGPTVISVHGYVDAWALRRSQWKKRLARLAYEDHNLAHASCVHALSQSEMNSVRDLKLACPVAVIPNGIAASWLNSSGNADKFRQKYNLPGDTRIMLFLGRITPKKGLPMLLHAMKALEPLMRDWVLVIAGVDEFNHEIEVRALADQLRLNNCVRYVGPLYGQDKRDAFAAAHLFVLPSYSEGAPVAIVEAMACGVPVLTTKASPWQELNRRQCGWCTDISQTAITVALEDALLQPPGSLEEKGKASRALIVADYTSEKTAERFAELYQWLIVGGSTPSFVFEQ